jgi:hypothetical protein
LADNGILPSMGSTGDSYDNALMENFWSTLKIELVYRSSWRTRDEAENAIFAYIDGWSTTTGHTLPAADLPLADFEALHDPNQTRLTEAARALSITLFHKSCATSRILQQYEGT